MPKIVGFSSRNADELLRGQHLSGKTAIVTGARSGIGLELTRVLARAGCRVIMAVRKEASGEVEARKLREGFESGGLQAGELVVKQCNLASFTEIRAFAEWLQGLSCSLDYLVLNAAVKNTPKWYTKEGHEMQMGVNFLGQFHLVQLLMPRLQSQRIPVRIVAVACKNEMITSMRLTDLNFSKVRYDAAKAYRGSKQAIALFAKELAARTAGSDISVFAADPGPTGGTMIDKYSPMWFGRAFSAPFLKTIPQGAATLVFALIAPVGGSSAKKSSEIQNGSLLSDCKVCTNCKVYGSSYHSKRVWQQAETMINRSVLDSHVAKHGMGTNEQFVMMYFLRPFVDFFLRMFGFRQY